MIHPLLRLAATEPHLIGDHVEAYAALVGEEVNKVSTSLILRIALYGAALFMVAVGLVLITLGLVAENPALFIGGALVGGFGQGLAYVGGQSLVELVTPPERRGEAFSTYLVVVYIAGSGCAISLGTAKPMPW